jgi:hypothetical protein
MRKAEEKHKKGKRKAGENQEKSRTTGNTRKNQEKV